MTHSDEWDADEAGAAVGSASRSYAVILWQRKSLLILGIILGVLGGLLLYWQRPPVYQSTAQVLVIKKRSDPLPVAGGDPRMGYVDDYMGTHMVLLRSPLIINAAINKRELASLKTFEQSSDPLAQILQSLAVTRDTPKDGNAVPNNIVNLAFR